MGPQVRRDRPVLLERPTARLVLQARQALESRVTRDLPDRPARSVRQGARDRQVALLVPQALRALLALPRAKLDRRVPVVLLTVIRAPQALQGLLG